jgi:hypothetical protein
MDVQVQNGLAGCKAVVDSNVESVRRELLYQSASRLLHSFPQRRHFFFCRVKDGRNMPLQKDERMTG